MTPFEAVAHYVLQQSDVKSYCVAYSGGLDSHVLLALMVRMRDRDANMQLRAVHIDHALQAGSARWTDHARNVCQALDVELEVRTAHYDKYSDAREHGPEASARIARYAEFSAVLQPGEHLLLAQHAEDQAETFLLQALRGSGPDGLSGIARKRRFAAGYMGRPLLVCSQESLQQYAQQEGLSWIEDPSNNDHRFDRNYLRHQVMPMLKARWPAATETLGRASFRCAAASQGLLSMAQQDLAGLRIPGTTELSISGIAALPRERAYAALRQFVRERGLRVPRLQDLVQLMNNLVHARPDSSGVVNVREYLFRRHRDQLFVLPTQQQNDPFRYTWNYPFEPLTIVETGLIITAELCRKQGVDMPQSGAIIVKSRAGGELIRMGNPPFHKAVKKLLQESSIPPWNRHNIPLLYIDGKLALVWNLALANNSNYHEEKSVKVT